MLELVTAKIKLLELLIIAALAATCGAAKLDRTYLPPASAKTAGGSPGSLQAPNAFSQNSAPKGSYTNDFQGVVVDAALAGTRASGSEETGLGAPRNSYGSTASKVGEAAFRGTQAGFRFPVSTQDNFGSHSESNQFGEAREIPEHSQLGVSRDSNQGFGDSRPERPQAAQDRAASTLRFDSEVGAESFNYAFETDNGISAEETGTATNGVQAQGGYSYTGDDGKVYTVTYTADEDGYQPKGDHLPTPPPIPEEILKSLEQNARDEANGVVDDGLYDAQKYNAGDYAESDSTNGKQNGRPSVNTGNGVDASGTFINQNNLPSNPRQRGDDKAVSQPASNNGFKSSAAGNRFGGSNEYLPPFQQKRPQNPRQQVPANADTADADSSSTFQQESFEGSGDSQSHAQQNQHTSRPSTTFSSKPSSNNQFNSFKQSSSNGNQFNQNGNRFPSSQTNRPQFGAAPVSTPSNNGHNQFSAHASASLSSQHSTSIPDTELTTPLESSPQDVHPSVPSTNSNTFGFNGQTPHNGQSQSSHHNSPASAQPTIPSFPQSRPQSSHNNNNRPFGENRNDQSAFSTQAPQQHKQFAQESAFGQQNLGTKRPPFSQNTVSQFAPSTQRPHFAHQPTAQDDESRPQSSHNNNNRPFGGNSNGQSAFSAQGPQQHKQLAQQSAFGQQTLGTKRPQFSQNQFSQNTDSQFAPSTQRPQFAQQSAAQDDSYYYNQPSRSFNTPQSQSSRFPSAPSNQFDRVTQQPFASQTTQYPEEENYPSTAFPSQNVQRQGSSRYPRPPSFPTGSSPSNNQFHSNAAASATNGITQASASPFAAPTSAPGFNRQQSSQSRQQFQQSIFQPNRPSSEEPSKPSFSAQTTVQSHSSRGKSQFEKQNFESAQPLSQQPLQDVKQPKLDEDTRSDAPVMNQQYNGEIYDYTKPAEMLPPPENGFGQFGTKMPSSQKPAQSRPQFGQTPAQQETSEPFAPQSTQFTQSAKSAQGQFAPRPQFSHTTPQSHQSGSSFAPKPQFGQAKSNQFGAQTQESIDADSKPARQQLSQAPEQQNQFNNQRRPFAQTQGNFEAAETPKAFGQNGKTCCKPAQIDQQTSFGGRPSQFGGDSSFDSTFQSNSAIKPDQSQSVAGKGEVFGGPRAPPSFDDTGYHY